MKKRKRAERYRKQAMARTRKKRTVKIIIYPNYGRISVDALMKPILQHLWGKGVKTLYCCAGHFPDFSAYITIERNGDFEKYARNSTWEHRTPLNFFGTAHDKFCLYARCDKNGYSRKNRALFLRWLLEY